MTLKQLTQRFKDIGVTPPDNWSPRCCLYLEHIKDVAKYFREDLFNSENEPHFDASASVFLKDALSDSDLLNSLCKILDEIIVQRLLTYKSQETYKDKDTYYNGLFLDGDEQVYLRKIEEFWNGYQVVKKTMNNVVKNYKENIRQACEHIWKDREHIRNTFLSNGTITKLTKIISTGSDFHKGGKQVLILNFSTNQGGNKILRVIYKPSDLSVDCLICGESEAINSIKPGFQEKSLFELFNEQIERLIGNKKQSLNGKILPLPTYKILPMATVPKDLERETKEKRKKLVRGTYGYIEFISHKKGNSTGTSDYIIYNPFKMAEKSQQFYLLIGQIAAIAHIFSFTDVHIENLIVKNFKPYLIDLEICMIKFSTGINRTQMFGGDSSSIQGVIRTKPPEGKDTQMRTRFSVTFSPPKKDGTSETETEEQKNRIYTKPIRGQKKIVEPTLGRNPENLLTGMKHMIGIILTNLLPYGGKQEHPDYTKWKARLNGVIVRYIPTATQDFINLKRGLFSLKDEKRKETYFKKIGEYYKSGPTNEQQADNPSYLCFHPKHMKDDYEDGDIPVFYHQLGTLDVIDSKGEKVLAPSDGKITWKAEDGKKYTLATNVLYEYDEKKEENTKSPRTSMFKISPFEYNIARKILLIPIPQVGMTWEALTKEIEDDLIEQTKKLLGLDTIPTDIS